MASNRKLLSKTDMVHLANALRTVRALGFSGTQDFTHRHIAYMAAWIDDSVKRSFPMNYALLISGQDNDLLDDIIYASRHA